jgi:hypothetical protein
MFEKNNNNLKIKIMKKLALISVCVLGLAFAGSAMFTDPVKKEAPKKETVAPVKKGVKKNAAAPVGKKVEKKDAATPAKK